MIIKLEILVIPEDLIFNYWKMIKNDPKTKKLEIF